MSAGHSVTAAQFPTYEIVHDPVTQLPRASGEICISELYGATGCRRIRGLSPRQNLSNNSHCFYGMVVWTKIPVSRSYFDRFSEFFPVKLLHDYRFSLYRELTLKFFGRISFWFATIQYNIVVMPQLRQPASGHSSRRPQFDSRPIHVGSVTKKLALWQVFFRVLQFPLPVSFHQSCMLINSPRPIIYVMQSLSHQLKTSINHHILTTFFFQKWYSASVNKRPHLLPQNFFRWERLSWAQTAEHG